MAQTYADTDRVKDVARSLDQVHRTLDDVTGALSGTARSVRSNKTLGDLGYDGAIQDVGTRLAGYSDEVEEYAKALLLVAESFESSEDAVVATMEGTQEGGFSKFLTGDLKAEGSWKNISGRAAGFLFGIGATGAAEGHLFYGKAAFEPKAEWNLTKGEAYVGVNASAEGSVLHGTLTGDYGILHGEAGGDFITGAVEGGLQASLFKDGKFHPNLEAKGKAKVAVASGKADGRIGTENYNAHVGASGDLVTASAEGRAYAGADGIGVDGEAGAYLAQGEVHGGATIFGIKIDGTLKGKAGGAGVEGGIGINWDKKVVHGKLGAGLGLGGGVEINIDFSGAAKAFEDTKKWWDKHKPW